jgi:methionine synthase II (cobalamin-independent)
MPPAPRADHVGSLLRPPEVLQAHADFASGTITADDLRRAEDDAIRQALDLQKQAGLTVFTDGEYRRHDWAGDFVASVDGYVQGPMPVTFNWRLPDEVSSEQSQQELREAMRNMPQQSGRVVGAKLHKRARLTQDETAFLQQHVPGAWKITMPAASYVVARGWSPGVTDKVYASRRELGRDAAEIIRSEIQAVAAEGAGYIQIDNPHYPDYIPDERRERYRELGIDPDKALEEDIDIDNASFAGLDRQRHTLATHVCRGNGARGAWHTAGGYERIAAQVFAKLDVDRFLLEYDSDRAGGFEPLRFVPKGKTVVLGLVTTKLSRLESQDLLLRRIEEASKYVDAAHLALSPQCGFASMEQGNQLSWDDQRRKLELVVETARKAWG